MVLLLLLLLLSLSSTNRSCLGLSIFISSVFSPCSIWLFLSSPSPGVFLSGFPSVPCFFFFYFILSLMRIIAQSRREVIASTAVTPDAWIGCGSPRLDFEWCRRGGLLHDGSKGKETQMHVRVFWFIRFGLIEAASPFL